MDPVSSLFAALKTFSLGAWSAHSDGMVPVNSQLSASITSISLGLLAFASYGPGIDREGVGGHLKLTQMSLNHAVRNRARCLRPTDSHGDQIGG